MELKFPPTFLRVEGGYYEGRWREEEKDDGGGLPFPKVYPQAHPLLWRFIEKLEQVQSLLPLQGTSSKKKNLCCLCEEVNDISQDYVLLQGGQEIRWAVGLIHYYVDHNVIPSREFYDIIMGFSLKVSSKPSKDQVRERDRLLRKAQARKRAIIIEDSI